MLGCTKKCHQRQNHPSCQKREDANSSFRDIITFFELLWDINNPDSLPPCSCHKSFWRQMYWNCEKAAKGFGNRRNRQICSQCRCNLLVQINVFYTWAISLHCACYSRLSKVENPKRYFNLALSTWNNWKSIYEIIFFPRLLLIHYS